MAEILVLATKSPVGYPPSPRLSRPLAAEGVPRSNAKCGSFASRQGRFLASLLAIPLSPTHASPHDV